MRTIIHTALTFNNKCVTGADIPHTTQTDVLRPAEFISRGLGQRLEAVRDGEKKRFLTSIARRVVFSRLIKSLRGSAGGERNENGTELSVQFGAGS